jgi:hypothetical protein
LALVAIAESTGEREILQVRLSAVLLGDNVVEVKRNFSECFREVTVFAAMFCPDANRRLGGLVHVRNQAGTSCKEKSGFGFQEFQRPADVQIIIQLLRFLTGQVSSVCLAGKFSHAMLIFVRKVQLQQLTCGGGGKISRFRLNGPAPNINFGDAGVNGERLMPRMAEGKLVLGRTATHFATIVATIT